MSEPINLDRARSYLKAIENGDASFIAELFAPEAFVEQLRNRIYPNGLRLPASNMAEMFAKGRKIFSKQTYEITNSCAVGNVIALEVLWTGTLSIPFGSLIAGSEMRCHSAMFLEFRDNQIISQRNYDCFEPW